MIFICDNKHNMDSIIAKLTTGLRKENVDKQIMYVL